MSSITFYAIPTGLDMETYGSGVTWSLTSASPTALGLSEPVVAGKSYHTISATGTGLTYAGGTVTGGTFTQVLTGLHSANGTYAYEARINGTNPAAGIDADNQTDWMSRFLAGDDNIASAAPAREIYGDRATVTSNVTGGKDVIRQDGLNTYAEAVISGDFIRLYDGSPSPVATGGNDQILGANGGVAGETLVGDLLDMFGGRLNGGADTIYGRGGDDSIFGDVGIALAGVAGNPTIVSGSDYLSGGDGNDVVVGDVQFANPATIVGGNDVLYGGNGNDALLGDIQNQHGPLAAQLHIRGGNDRLYGEAGDDILVGNGGNDTLDGGAGTDVAGYNQQAYDASGNIVTGGVVLKLGEGTAWGTATGSHGSDMLRLIENVTGSLGDDQITGNSGANLLNGSTGNDLVRGMAGGDTLLGEDGDDEIEGGDGDDFLAGNLGDDRLLGDLGNDTLRDDEATSATEFDVLDGGAGNDLLISGETGTRVMDGGAGNDVLEAFGGTTWATLGAGADIVRAEAVAAGGVASTVHVYDFLRGTDRIDLSDIGATSANVAQKVGVQDWGVGAALVYTDAASHVNAILLHGVAVASIDLHGSDFILA